jgi:hypothetical protein
MTIARTGDLEQTVLPSPHVALLAPSARDAYAHRLADAVGTAAEQYQANSRMRPWELVDVPTDEDVAALREWFLRTGRTYDSQSLVDGAEAPLRPLAGLPGPIAGVLSHFGVDGQFANSLFANDIVVALDDELLLMPPRGAALVFERQVPDWRRRLADAVPPPQRDHVERAAAVLAVVTVPWRHMVLYGERGYRRALMETGTLTSSLCGLAAKAGLRPRPLLDFVDTTVDDLLGNDGVERFCAALVTLTPAGGSQPSEPGGTP